MERIKKCRVCGSENLADFFDLGDQPFANSLPKRVDGAEKRYPLSLSFCNKCSLVQLNHTAPPEELFAEYVWITGTSKTAREYAKSFYEGVLKRVRLSKNDYVIEAASNDGTFLKPFLDNGHKVIGVDPAKNIADMANKNGVATLCEFFGENTAKTIVADKGVAKVVIARNVVPHVANLHDFIAGMAASIDESGMAVIEFHYAKIIIDDLHYDSIYHEHLCYYTLKSIEALLNRHDLFVCDIEESPINAGNRILFIKKGKQESSSNVKLCRKIESGHKLNTLENWQRFAQKSFEHKEKLNTLLEKIKTGNKTIYGYGASARSSTMLNFCGVGIDIVEKIVDQNPLKHNRFTAGTHIPIVDPKCLMQEHPDSILLLAWNFKDEILKILKNEFNYKGGIIIPLPEIHCMEGE